MRMERELTDGKKCFVNFTNHSAEKWGSRQKEAAERYGKIVDYPFPNVNSRLTTEQINDMAERISADIEDMNPAAVMCQGEFTLAYAVIRLLQKRGITVLAACSERQVTESVTISGELTKTVVFDFVQFREYSVL